MVGEYAKDISAERWGTYVAKTSFSGVCGSDTDGDSVPDAADNCVNTANGSAEASTPGVGNQTNTDADLATAGWRLGAGWTTCDESFIGTDPSDSC